MAALPSGPKRRLIADRSPETRNNPLGSIELLPPRQRGFVREYVADFNGTQAAIRAGYSARSAYSQATRLLKNADVRTAVAELSSSIESEAVQAVQGSRAELLSILWKIARGRGHPSARIAAVRALAPTYGLTVEAPKVTSYNPHRQAEMSEAEARDELKRRGIDPDQLMPSTKR